MAAEISTKTVFLISAVIIVAVVIGLGVWIYSDRIEPILGGVMKNMGVYQITIKNEEQFRGLLQCLAAAHYHFGKNSQDKLTQINFKDLDSTEMQGCTITGKVPQKVHVKFKIDNSDGYIILASGDLMPPEYKAYGHDPLGSIYVSDLNIEKGDSQSMFNSKIFPFVEYRGIDCTPIRALSLGSDVGWAVIVQNGIVEKNSTDTVYCKGAIHNKLNLASFRIYDGTEADLTIYHDRNIDRNWIFGILPRIPDLKLDDVLIITMKIEESGIKKEK